jgi:hypothetical protein
MDLELPLPLMSYDDCNEGVVYANIHTNKETHFQTLQSLKKHYTELPDKLEIGLEKKNTNCIYYLGSAEFKGPRKFIVVIK